MTFLHGGVNQVMWDSPIRHVHHPIQIRPIVQLQIRDRCAANLAVAREALSGSPAGILTVEGGWYITLQVPRTRGEEEWVLELLARENILVQPGFFYDFESEAFLVVSLLTAPGIFREGVRRLRRML